MPTNKLFVITPAGKLNDSPLLEVITSALGKVIFSVNLQDLNNVDPALLRPGRCFQVLHFSYLKGDDLEKAKDKIGSEFFTDLPIKSGGYTIAELFAHRDCEPIDEVNTNTSSIGFKVGFAP